jgi:hypothetical protein
MLDLIGIPEYFNATTNITTIAMLADTKLYMHNVLVINNRFVSRITNANVIRIYDEKRRIAKK